MAISFTESNRQNDDTIMIVDALNLAFRYYHQGAVNFSHEYVNTVKSLAKSYKAKHVVIACDQGSSSYRKAILPTYKQGRKDKFEAQTEEERLKFEEFFAEFSLTIEELKKIYPLVFRFDKCEADDIAAYIVGKLGKTHKIWLISSDKDWDLLISYNVSRFSYVTRKEITLDNWYDHYDYDPEDHISVKCLTGDSGDSIPGVPGIGPVKAKNLVREYGSTYDIIASMPIQSKYKYIQALNEFGADALLNNYKLMDLVSHCAEALGQENCAVISAGLKEHIK